MAQLETDTVTAQGSLDEATQKLDEWNTQKEKVTSHPGVNSLLNICHSDPYFQIIQLFVCLHFEDLIFSGRVDHLESCHVQVHMSVVCLLVNSFTRVRMFCTLRFYSF